MKRIAVLFLVLTGAGCAGRLPRAATTVSADTALKAAQFAWWRAMTVADTAYLRAHSTDALTLTLSSGLTFDRDGMLAEFASHTTGADVVMSSSDEAVRFLAPNIAIVTSRFKETAGRGFSTYRYTNVFERIGADWRVTAAQSTREIAYSPRVAAEVAGSLVDFAGSYRTPRNLALRVLLRDSSLVLKEPSGKELGLAPVGPALFELTGLSPANGIVRVSFTRNDAGRVTSMNQIIFGAVNTFPRIP